MQVSTQGLPMWGGYTPRSWQADALPIALAAIERGDRGIIQAATGSGKSILAAEIVARLVPTLQEGERLIVSAPTQDLVGQLGRTMQHRLPGLVGAYYQHSKSLNTPVIVACHNSMFDSDTFCPQCHPARWDEHTKMHDGEALVAIREEFKAAGLAEDYSRCEKPWDHDTAATNITGLARALMVNGLSVRYWMADECHKTECGILHGWAQWTTPQDSIGFTATPWRSSEKQALELFDTVLYQYTIFDGIRDGVIMAPTIVHYGGDETDLDMVCLEMIKGHLAKHPTPGVVNAQGIADAKKFAQLLEAHGIRTMATHSKIKKAEQKKRIALLESGEIDVLVYDSLLAEGSDFPWLHWMCLRRQGSTSVRFPQEVGRVLRIHPGKTHAWVLDPNDLAGQFALDYAANVGTPGPPTIQSEIEQLAAKIAKLFAEEGTGASRGSKALKARALSHVRSWVRKTALGLKFIGAINSKVTTTSWRKDRASDKQIRAVSAQIKKPGIRRAARGMDAAEAKVLREAIKAARDGEFNAGDVADLIDILDVLKDRGELPELAVEVGQ